MKKQNERERAKDGSTFPEIIVGMGPLARPNCFFPRIAELLAFQKKKKGRKKGRRGRRRKRKRKKKEETRRKKKGSFATQEYNLKPILPNIFSRKILTQQHVEQFYLVVIICVRGGLSPDGSSRFGLVAMR